MESQRGRFDCDQDALTAREEVDAGILRKEADALGALPALEKALREHPSAAVVPGLGRIGAECLLDTRVGGEKPLPLHVRRQGVQLGNQALRDDLLAARDRVDGRNLQPECESRL